ncbi:MAG: 4-(cytidine 5'-diphospho)-2-C-methyl-D-erythritol kinase [Oscillospiraceae bacterium]|nr:4-(cytidine 5'-diphospho)-2-C-methyl-D-erythritol kinase [Oscillospiraceae bacterium]
MIGNTLVLQVPAKINLSLDITGRRADGYHTLSSVFQTVSVYDTLTLTKTGAETPFSLTCNVDGIPCDERNLVAKAAVALLGESPCGVSIHLEKQIPSQAGMGGGSADCAAALLGIRKLLALPVTDEMLHAMAVKLGADVPFFLVGGTVLAQGIGDVLTPLAPIPQRILVIAKGNEGISTPVAYKQIDALTEPLPTYTESVLAHLGCDDLFSFCGNAFDAVADNEEIRLIRRIMRQHGANPVLSGSGAAVFCGMSDLASAQACVEELKEAGLPFAMVARTTQCGVEGL